MMLTASVLACVLCVDPSSVPGLRRAHCGGKVGYEAPSPVKPSFCVISEQFGEWVSRRAGAWVVGQTSRIQIALYSISALRQSHGSSTEHVVRITGH
ncbi:hypothetical protein VTN96DRAFT_4484 [Rasamsonia emersonii]